MKDADCAAFLQRVLPQIGLRWRGFRKVRGQVCKRIGRRMWELGLSDMLAYREHLQSNTDEWQALAALCTIPISRFHRDKRVFECVGSTVLPALAKESLARGSQHLECWSAGCACGEEPYTLAIQWRMLLAPRFPELGLRVLGTDVDAVVLKRASVGCYKPSSLEALPSAWCDQAFERCGKLLCLHETWRRDVEFERQDLLLTLPQRVFDLVLCRNVAFTYFAAEQARQALDRIAARLRPGGALVIGIHEELPEERPEFEPWPGCGAVFRRGAAP